MRSRSYRDLVAAIVASLCCAMGSGLGLARAGELPTDGRSRFVGREWQVDDGLLGSHLEALGRSNDGYLWIGSYNEGPVRFDGVTFTRLKEISPEYAAQSKRDDATTVLLGSSDGGLWVGSTIGGLIRWHGDGRVSAYTTAQGLPDKHVRSAFEGRDGSLWVGTDAGLCRIKDGRVELVVEPGGPGNVPISALLEDPDGTLWAATKTRGLFRKSEDRWTSFDDKSGEGLGHLDVLSLLRDRGGRLWVGTAYGLYRLEAGQFRCFKEEAGLKHPTAMCLGEDRWGTLWVGTTHGTFTLREDDTFEPITTGLGASQRLVFSLLCDREGGTWVATSAGLYRFRPREVEIMGVEDGLADSLISTVCTGRDGSIWAATCNGLNQIGQDGRVRTFVGADVLPTWCLTAVHADRGGDIWVGTWGSGLYRFGGGRLTRYTKVDGLGSDIIRSILEARDGTVWIGTWGGGLGQLRDGRLATLSSRDGLGADRVRALLEDHLGRLWVGTIAGLSRIEGGRITTYTVGDGLSSDSIFSLHEDAEGVLWIGTSGGGLVKFEGGRFTAFTTRDGLFSDMVTQILEDREGNLWLGSHRGIFRVTKQQLNDRASGRLDALSCLTYSRTEGMRIGHCSGGSQPSGCRGVDGRLWFATLNGLAIVDPAHAAANDVVPPTTIEAAIVDGQRVVDGKAARPGRGDLEFHFTACSFGDPSKVRFRYQLGGFDHGWVEAGTRRTAFYTNVPPGRYIFRVRACNDDGLWGTVGASTNVELSPYFHQTSRFRAACIFFILLILGFLYRERMEAVRRRELELVRVVAERTIALENAKDELELRNLQLAKLAATDALTGLWNRRHFVDSLGSALALATPLGRPTSILMLDVDHFKSYNDTFGHPAGDEALRNVAAVLRSSAREFDEVARYGGEEFIVLLPGSGDVDARNVAERFRRGIEAAEWPYRSVTASIGVATVENGHVIEAEILVSFADLALYRAKRAGRNRVCHYNDGGDGEQDAEAPISEKKANSSTPTPRDRSRGSMHALLGPREIAEDELTCS